MSLFKPYGTPYTPKSFGMNARKFFLAVLRASPTGSTLHLDQDEGDAWHRRLAEWSQTIPGQYGVDHYRIDERFVTMVEQLLADDPACLDDLHHMSIRAKDGRTLMASVDDFSIITMLDEQIRLQWSAGKDQ